jgi:hypothetical protein
LPGADPGGKPGEVPLTSEWSQTLRAQRGHAGVREGTGLDLCGPRTPKARGPRARGEDTQRSMPHDTSPASAVASLQAVRTLIVAAICDSCPCTAPDNLRATQIRRTVRDHAISRRASFTARQLLVGGSNTESIANFRLTVISGILPRVRDEHAHGEQRSTKSLW